MTVQSDCQAPSSGPPPSHFGDKFSQVSRAVIHRAWTSYQQWAHSRDNFLCVVIKWWLSDGKRLLLLTQEPPDVCFCGDGLGRVEDTHDTVNMMKVQAPKSC